jgi:hypothetical protein
MWISTDQYTTIRKNYDVIESPWPEICSFVDEFFDEIDEYYYTGNMLPYSARNSLSLIVDMCAFYKPKYSLYIEKFMIDIRAAIKK